MKPVARLHLIKQREYEKRCPPNNGQRGMGGIGNPSIGMFNAGGSEFIYGLLFNSTKIITNKVG